MKNKTATLTLGLVLVAGSALASNTGFKLNYTLLKKLNTLQNNFVSVPSFYFPTGVVGNYGNSVDFCQDLNEGDRFNTPKVTQVIDFDSSADAFITQQCNAPVTFPARFPMTVGKAYSVKAKNDLTVVNVVGSNDDDYSKPPKCSGGGCKFIILRKVLNTLQNNFVSVPYHIKSDNSVDLCQDVNNGDRFNTPKVTQVIDFDSASDAFITQQCNAPATFPARFTLVPGKGYSMKAKNDNEQIQMDVY